MMNIGIFHMKKIILAVGAMLTMAVTCFAANPESDFSYDLVTKAELKILAGQFKELDPNEDYVEVLSYKGDQNAELIEIPEEIEGCKVIKISGTIPAQTKKVVVPASVVLVRNFETGYYANTTIDFLRAKDLPFAWGGLIRMKNWTELPTDRKIIFVNGDERGVCRIHLPELETFTWPKNWSCMMYGKPYYMGVNDKGFYEQGDEKLLVNDGHDDRAFPYLYYDKGELRFEEGIEVFPVGMNGTSCKIVLPKSMKTVWKLEYDSALIKFSGGEKGNIVIPEGAKINFKPGCISGQLSISTKKALHAQGYDTDNN